MCICEVKKKNYDDVLLKDINQSDMMQCHYNLKGGYFPITAQFKVFYFFYFTVIYQQWIYFIKQQLIIYFIHLLLQVILPIYYWISYISVVTTETLKNRAVLLINRKLISLDLGIQRRCSLNFL